MVYEQLYGFVYFLVTILVIMPTKKNWALLTFFIISPNICGHRSAIIIPVNKNIMPNKDNKSWHQKPQHSESLCSSFTLIKLLKKHNV